MDTQHISMVLPDLKHTPPDEKVDEQDAVGIISMVYSALLQITWSSINMELRKSVQQGLFGTKELQTNCTGSFSYGILSFGGVRS